MRRSRRRERVYARRHGYFWLPCPLCGDYFGGHELRRGVIPYENDPSLFAGICSACTTERQAYLEQMVAEGQTEGRIGCGREDGRMVWHDFPYALPGP